MSETSHLEVRLSWLNELLDSSLQSLESGPQLRPIMGLFATTNIEEGIEVCRYYGKIHRTKDAISLLDKSYLMRLGEQCYVDAKEDETCLARYINDCRNMAGYNVRMEKYPDQQYASLISTRRIYADEEIFVNYGKYYWAGCVVKPIRLTFSDLCKRRPHIADESY